MHRFEREVAAWADGVVFIHFFVHHKLELAAEEIVSEVVDKAFEGLDLLF